MNDVDLDQVAYSWQTCFVPKSVQPGQQVSFNCRFSNTGPVTLNSEGPRAFRLSGFWVDECGHQTEFERTELLTDVLPGSALSVPVRATSPSRPGTYIIKVALMVEGVRWFTDNALVAQVTVRSGMAAKPICDLVGGVAGYEEDHRIAIDMLRQWTANAFDRGTVAVELGGNFSPCAVSMGLSVLFNVDIDATGLQFAQLREAAGTHVVNICADGYRLPFGNRSLDLILMFATFHHFAEPSRLLRHLRSKLRRGGHIALLCEPVGHVTRATAPEEYLAELRKGVNEQSFSLDEYAEMFREAKLRIEHIAVQSGSLKAFLAPD